MRAIDTVAGAVQCVSGIRRLFRERFMTTPTAPSTEVGDYGASTHYDATYFSWQNANIELKTKIKAWRFAPHIRPTDIVLDFGCAGGGMLAALPGSRKIGVELNDVARESAAREHGLETHKTLDVTPDHVADVIVSNHTLEHLASPYEALRQLRSKLKPGGKLVLVLPIDDWRAQRRWDPHDINRHLYTWSPMNLGNLLDEAGWTPLEMRVIRRTLMRGFNLFGKLPRPLFEAVSWAYSVLRHRQELLAVAKLKSPPATPAQRARTPGAADSQA
jgi:SAM-dependent methyltransferase